MSSAPRPRAPASLCHSSRSSRCSRAIGFQPPCGPSFHTVTRKKLDFPGAREHVVNALTYFAWFVRVCAALDTHKLSNVPRPARRRYPAMLENKAKLALTHGIESRVDPSLVPHEGDGRPCETPCLAERDGLVEMWIGRPHEQQAVVRRYARDIERTKHIQRHGRIVLRCPTCVSSPRPGMLQLTLVIPRRIGVDDLETARWKFRKYRSPLGRSSSLSERILRRSSRNPPSEKRVHSATPLPRF